MIMTKKTNWKAFARISLGICVIASAFYFGFGGCLQSAILLAGVGLIAFAIPDRVSTYLLVTGFLWISVVEGIKLVTLDDPSPWSWFGAIFFGLLFLLSVVIFVLNRVIPDGVLKRWGGDSEE